ncbi:metallophosphoesterase [uncultured Methanobrevibacter sp.]|uniref:metallophosphoesterase n=1 Tax=uncultured Methanobrevibacter sp. TaxID=253161 RepID=UPI0025DDF09E|nr:metallophosphoesterase [uncultured Methanobrevibacter sp.]
MKIWMISDTHLGCRTNSVMWIELIRSYFYEFFIPLIKKEANPKEDILYHLGDVFDNRQSINIAVQNLAIELFDELTKYFKEIHIIVGNHDIMKKNSTDITSVDCLKYMPKVYIHKHSTIKEYIIDGKVIKCALMPWQVDEQEELDFLSKKADYLFCHAEIKGHQMTNSIHNVVEDGVEINEFAGYKRVYSGHIHYGQHKVGTNIIYVGNPYQMTRSDISNTKGIYCLDLTTGKENFYENTYSPVFLKFYIDEILDVELSEFFKKIKGNFVDILVPSSYMGKYDINKLILLCSEYANRLDVIVNDDGGIDDIEEMQSDFNILNIAKTYIANSTYDDELKEKLLNSFIALYNECLNEQQNI